MSDGAPALLTAATVVPYLVSRGEASTSASATELGGGVSNGVFRIHDDGSTWIVKQSLPQLRVAEEWLAPQERVITEAEGLSLAAALLDDGAPRVRFIDDNAFVLGLESAPANWVDWKSSLLAGNVQQGVASRVGEIVGLLHRATQDGELISDGMSDPEPFEQLRLRPYYEYAAKKQPQWSADLKELADELRANRVCLVHGDLSPKNVLAPPVPSATRAWLIDFEVAHFGDPRFDVAFLLTHLTMKAIHRSDLATSLDEAARAFDASYTEAVESTMPPDLPGALRHVGALLIARVHGKSPAEYLTQHEQHHAERVAQRALEGRMQSLEDLFSWREETRE